MDSLVFLFLVDSASIFFNWQRITKNKMYNFGEISDLMQWMVKSFVCLMTAKFEYLKLIKKHHKDAAIKIPTI